MESGGNKPMGKPSPVELTYLAFLWSADPSRKHLCPSCLAVRKAEDGLYGEHADWCARKREIESLERAIEQGNAYTPEAKKERMRCAQESNALAYINSKPALLSLLYDLDLLPEQLEEGSKDWNRMLILTAWHKATHTGQSSG